VVDDNATNRRILAESLSRWGMFPIMAESAAAAIQLLESSPTPVSVILTDVHMPEMDVFELADRIKRRAAVSTIVMLTSGSHVGDVERCRELGIDAYLTKPVAQHDFRSAILRVIGHSSAYAAAKAKEIPGRHRSSASGAAAVRCGFY
jgi:two-component system, sensor histidine kinase and response regulator